MASECELGLRIERGGGGGGGGGFFLQKFKLYETQSKFYLVGRDKSRTHWRVLTIDRLEPLELDIREDPTVYSESECNDLLRRINEGNVYIGGLKFVTVCYGIVGFVKFLGPYYMLLITRRKLIGTIHGNAIYAITKTEMIVLPNSTVQCNMINTKDENRYKKLLCTVDLTKDFFFSYSYGVMHSLQKNLGGNQKSQICYDTMFVWNEFLTAGVRKHLGSTIWTVALVYGFFKQVKFSISGKDFNLTLICRRSRHYAGPRYLKRGVNEKGRVANDVETEQIVFEYFHGGYSTQIASVVQHRGSIPLFWSQETSRLNIKPDIILQKNDQKFEATKLHFENLACRYGNPIIVWNLIKTREKKPRESILRAEFGNAIETINKSLPEDKHVRFLHWDLSKHSKSKPTQVLELLSRIAEYALTLTGFFYCHQVTPALTLPDAANWNGNRASEGKLNENSNVTQNSSVSENGSDELKLQNGVLRTNCIDCLDRTNVAQYAFGLAALGHQLHALGFIDHPRISLNGPLADELMTLYEIMGDTLALQYGGSPAHNKIFSERRGQWKAATQSQEFLRTLQRYYSNAWMDAEKQRAINVFLGYFLPQQGKPALWELDSDQHCNVGRRENTFANENSRSLFKRSLSDGNILCENNTAVLGTQIASKKLVNCPLPDKITQEECKDLSDNTAEATARESDTSYSRYTPEVVRRQLFLENDQGEYESNYSNFLDFDLLSSSGNSCDEDFERSSLVNSPLAGCSSENISGTPGESASLRVSSSSITKEADIRNAPLEFSDRFKNWVLHGEMLAYDEFISTP